ncbi:MAG: indole-3-glycerol-phosphate synthase [bacterium]|nr:indole-3-glycerol-phosphate synthase [bacterium]
MSIIEDIIIKKKEEIEYRKKTFNLDEYKSRLDEIPIRKPPKNFFIIGEFKRKTPKINMLTEKKLEDVLTAYEKAGISMVSILTEKHYFSGDIYYISLARAISKLPILRKDFIIDEYQVFETKIFGADAILFIREILDLIQLEKLHKIAKDLKLTTIIETHEKIDFIELNPDFVGLNNRNLFNLEIEKDRVLELIKKIPPGTNFIVESAINSADEIKLYKDIGAKGVLIGEHFLRLLNKGEDVFLNAIEEIFSKCL